MYEFLAKIVLLTHVLFILFVVFGSFFYLLSPKLIYLHLLALAWGVYIEFSNSICPLTYLENWLLIKDQASFYNDGFIENYIMRIVYPQGINAEVQIILGINLIMVNLIFYLLIFYFKFVKKNN
tara:strand:+ start:364 stop:735 length:372 start_codon:yes stop_codon:yes gene_type:complete